MRIVHISTCDIQGGAARAAWRLVRGLDALGHKSRMLVKSKTSSDPLTVQWAGPEGGTEAVRSGASLVDRYYIQRHRTPLSNTRFSLPGPGCDVAAHEEVAPADVVNLHWVTDFLSPRSIAALQRSGKPVIWTLHDQRAFTGGCHYAAGCRKFETECDGCPQLDRDDLGLTRAALQESMQELAAPPAVVCPSRWLARDAAQSALFRHARITVIPYGLETDVFKPGRAEARQKLQLDPQAVCLLFGADSLTEARKGFDLFNAAARACLADAGFQKAVSQQKILFLYFGSAETPPQLDFPARWLRRIESDAALAQLYAACDAFILPSREDNLPNTMLESMCCGTPVIGFNIGGLPDLVIPGENGLLAPPDDVSGLAQAITSFCSRPELRRKLAQNCESEIPARCGLTLQAERYTRLYEEEKSRGPAAASRAGAEDAESAQPFGRAFAEVFPALIRRARQERRAKRWKAFKNSLAGAFSIGKSVE